MIAGFKTRLMNFFNPAAAGTDAPDSDTALMVIDVQKEFCSPWQWRGTRDTHKIACTIAGIVPSFRAVGVPVYAVYFVDAPDHHLEAVRRQMEHGTDHYKFYPGRKDRVILKNRDSVFSHDEVSAQIHDAGHQNLLMCGFNLNSCVKKSAIDGASAGFNIRILRDLCGNDRENPEPYTSRAVTKMKENGIIFSDSATELSALRHARGVVP